MRKLVVKESKRTGKSIREIVRRRKLMTDAGYRWAYRALEDTVVCALGQPIALDRGRRQGRDQIGARARAAADDERSIPGALPGLRAILAGR